MSWIEAKLTTGKQEAPLVELLFEELGALSVTLVDAEDEPLLEPAPGELPLWQRTRVTGLFEGDTDLEQLRYAIASRLNRELGSALTIEPLQDQVWERAWLEHFRPMRFGQKLWVCPDGMPAEDPDATVIELDPGLAFGTGTHPTTALCLQWLDANPPQDLQVIDFGCGSGILSLAALKLGAGRVHALDHDPQALQATRDNALKNHCEAGLVISADAPGEPADLVLANILAGTLIELESLMASLVRPGGRILLSGILREQAGQVSESYQADFEMQPPALLGDWVALEGRRR